MGGHFETDENGRIVWKEGPSIFGVSIEAPGEGTDYTKWDTNSNFDANTVSYNLYKTAGEHGLYRKALKAFLKHKPPTISAEENLYDGNLYAYNETPQLDTFKNYTPQEFSQAKVDELFELDSSKTSQLSQPIKSIHVDALLNYVNNKKKTPQLTISGETTESEVTPQLSASGMEKVGGDFVADTTRDDFIKDSSSHRYLNGRNSINRSTDPNKPELDFTAVGPYRTYYRPGVGIRTSNIFGTRYYAPGSKGYTRLLKRHGWSKYEPKINELVNFVK